MPKAEADVVVVGAGPGGSAAAAHLARRGLGVLLLEKSRFPREKVCGDGLTPRATRSLVRLGIDTSVEAGWLHNKGLRIYGGSVEPFQLDWPSLTDYPPYGLVRPRADFDNLLAQHAVAQGAEMHQGVNITEAILDDRTGRIVGVRSRNGDEYTAPLVVAADGNSSRLSVSMGLNKRNDRPMGVAYRAYYTSPRTHDDYLESWLELWDGKPRESTLMPGYGWIFGMGDGTCNVGLGVLNTSKSFQKTDYRELMRRWLANTPEEWGFREENRVNKIQGAALNGEGIAYAMESAELAADAIAEAHARGIGTEPAERALHGYRTELKARLGGYYRLGTIFVKLIGDPRVMHLCTTYGLPHKTLMRFVMKLLANLTDRHDGDAMDRIINALCKAAPSA